MGESIDTEKHNLFKRELHEQMMHYFVRGGVISSLGARPRPLWVNNATLYQDFPVGTSDMEKKLREIDPEIEIDYTTGWKVSKHIE